MSYIKYKKTADRLHFTAKITASLFLACLSGALLCIVLPTFIVSWPLVLSLFAGMLVFSYSSIILAIIERDLRNDMFGNMEKLMDIDNTEQKKQQAESVKKLSQNVKKQINTETMAIVADQGCKTVKKPFFEKLFYHFREKEKSKNKNLVELKEFVKKRNVFYKFYRANGTLHAIFSNKEKNKQFSSVNQKIPILKAH